MAAESPPFALQNASHSAALFREALSSLILPAGGVVGVGDLLVTQSVTPAMSVSIAAGQVWVPGTSAPPAQGLYYGFNDAPVTLAIAASNATNPRIDRIVATVNDAAYTGVTNNWVLQVITGTPTAGATLVNLSGAGAVPANSLLLSNVLVPNAATTIVTADLADKRLFAKPGLIVPGQLLTSLSYSPAGNTSYSTTSATAVPIDLVNLVTPPFVVPPSGAFDYYFEAFIWCSASAAGYLGPYLDAATLVGAFSVLTESAAPARVGHTYRVSGQVPGSSHTVQPIWQISASQFNISCGAAQGEVYQRVTAV